MSYMEHSYLLNLIYVWVITKLELMNPLLLKPLSADMKVVMISWWCLLVLVMHLPLFKALWTISFNHFYTILSLYSLMISWSTIKLGRHTWHKWIRSYKSSTITNYSSNILNVIKWNILGTLLVKVEYVLFLRKLRQWNIDVTQRLSNFVWIP